MNAIDFTNFVPRDWIQPLTWLGRRDWVEVVHIENEKRAWVRLNPSAFKSLTPEEFARKPREHWEGVQEVADAVHKMGDPIAYCMYLSLSKCLAQGPKVFIPTALECEAMENTAVSIPFEVYHQPYPVMLIEIPKEYRRSLTERFGVHNAPQYVFVNHLDQKRPHSIITTAFFDRKNSISHLSVDRPEYETIEDTITKNRERRTDWGAGGMEYTAEFEAAEIVQRLAINFSFIMATKGVNVIGPLDPEAWKKHKKMASSKNPRDRERGQKFMASKIEVIALKQRIQFYEEEFFGEGDAKKESGGGGEGLGRSPRPHWRKGHYRRQWKGTGEERRREYIWIKAVLVRAKFFIGDLSQTSVTYEGVGRRNPPPQEMT
jgi:hypothetical protein